MRYLIVGFGNIGHKRQAVLGKKCVATVDHNPEQKADFKDSRDVPKDIFDSAVLTIPQQAKFQLTKYFLSIGKNVLVEKPLIFTPKEGMELLKLSKKNNCTWYTSYNHRFEPNLIRLSKILKKGFLGKLYHGRFVYGFGNIQERIGTWRETEYGVLEEIVPHLIDFIFLNFNYRGGDFKTVIKRKVESKIFDHFIISTTDSKILIEVSSVTWKNIFSIDLYGMRGSLHINGLRKWEGSKLITRKRILPSGLPLEKQIFDQGPDLSWAADFKYFEEMIKAKVPSYNWDVQANLALVNMKKTL